jgi:hypothetical protein
MSPSVKDPRSVSRAMNAIAGAALALAIAAPATRGHGADIDAAGPVAEAPKIRFSLDEAEGKPGDVVTLVLSITTNVPLRGVKVAINFDETTLRLEEASRAVDPISPSPLDDVSKQDVDNRDEEPGNQALEGWIYLELTASNTTGELKWPVGESIPVYKLDFRILEKATRGRSPVVFAKVGPEDSAELNNAAAVKAPAAVDPAIEIPPEDLVDGTVVILGLGEIGFFLRADVNLDFVRDISDPIRTLNFLFSSGDPLLCEDAADANDDGRLDLSDPIYTLYWLYASGNPPPDPQSWGPDPTRDKLCCKDTGGCS